MVRVRPMNTEADGSTAAWREPSLHIKTQKGPDNAGKGRIFRAKSDIPKRETAANRTDIERLYDGLPEPLDLELDRKNRLIYWTERGDPPRGNTANRAPMDADSKKRREPDILLTHLMEGIRIALDFKGDWMCLTDLAGSIYSAKLDGTGKKPLPCATISVPSGAASSPPIAVPSVCASTPRGLAKRRKR